MKKKTYILFAFSFWISIGMAVNVAPFLHESFNGNAFPSNWSTGDASGQGKIWQHCSNPQACPPASFLNLKCSDPLFNSSSFYDGYMFMNSFAAGVLTAPSQAYLRMPQIDCSTKDKVFLQFYTFIDVANFAPDLNAIVRVKSGNGPWTSFTVFPDMNLQTVSNLTSYNAQLVQLDISSAAALQSNVTIEWYWKANFELAWMIDDVNLFDDNPMNENVVWGLGQNQGSFAGGNFGWTVINNQYDSCHWIWVDSAMLHLANNEKRADALACWPGVENGAMLMNASFCGRFGNPNETRSRSDLQSPTIDLSGVPAGTQLYLRFNQAFDLGNTATTALPVASVSVSINNASSFIDTINANPLMRFFYAECEEAFIPLPLEVAGNSQVRLRFIFSGDSHFWMVDDVRIVRAYEFDLALNEQFYNVAPDFEVPVSQVSPIRMYSQVKNLGSLPASGVTAHVAVFNALNETVFEDSMEVGTLLPNTDFTEVIFPNRFMPAHHPESYIAHYWVTSAGIDQNPRNNRASWRYKVTEGVFSKNGFCKNNANYFFPTAEAIYEIGNCYYMPKGSKLRAVSLSFAYDDNNGKLSNSSNPVLLQTNLYRWSKGGFKGDVNNDTIANEEEYERIAINNYEIDSEDNHKVVTLPISDEGDSLILEDDTYYFVTVAYLAPVLINFVPIRFPIAASEEINYTSMFYNSYDDGLPAFVSMLREGNDDFFRANAWALRRIPFVNLNVSEIINSTEEDFGWKNDILELSPNPANDFVRVTAEIQGVQKPISLEFFDLCGRKVLERHFESENVSQQPILVSELSNGAYIVRVTSDGNVASKKLMVIH